MSNVNERVTLFLLFLLGTIGFFSCDTVESRVELPDEPNIEYKVYGGIGGGTQTLLSIDEKGKTLLKSTYPELEKQLNDAEYEEILTHFKGFDEIPEDMVNNACADDFFYGIKMNTINYTKETIVNGCRLWMEENPGKSVRKLRSITNSLDSLAGTIYDNQKPWRDLKAEFSTDKDSYMQSESIIMSYKVTNPSSEERAIYFEGEQQTWFRLFKEGTTDYRYEQPDYRNADEGDPSQLVFEPGETKELTYVWDQILHKEEGNEPLPSGYYFFNLNLLSGYFETAVKQIEIIDPSTPVTGKIIPDRDGESRCSEAYTFKLLLKNWTDAPVTINFPAGKELHIELYDERGPERGEHVYTSPEAIDDNSHTVTLSPDEEVTFFQTVKKSEMNDPQSWHYIKISLTSSNVTFEEKGDIRFYDYDGGSCD